MHVRVCARARADIHACMHVCEREREEVLSIIVKCCGLPPCEEDGHYRNPICYFIKCFSKDSMHVVVSVTQTHPLGAPLYGGKLLTSQMLTAMFLIK